ncbi:MAG: hypothetical protein BroJett021_07060 [Chloroflexota bacterium]|nr:MAG: hypothetical protein BroJett021_07060 [Chloroflexota bacterium]
MKNSAVVSEEELNRDTPTQAADISTDLVTYPHALTSEESEFQRRKRLQQETYASIHRFSAQDRLSRDEVHIR